MSASKLSKDGTGTREVAAHVPHKALHFAFVVALAGTPEPVLEQVVGLQLGEGPGALAPAVAKDLRYGQPGIVVEDALGHSAQVGEGGNVPVQEGLGSKSRFSPMQESRNTTNGFAARTRTNLQLAMASYCERQDFHMVMQVVNSFVGIVMVPWVRDPQAAFLSVSLCELANAGLPQMEPCHRRLCASRPQRVAS